MFDSYGTLHDGVKPLPGVREALIKLQEMGKEIVVVANGWVRLTPTDFDRWTKIGGIGLEKMARFFLPR